MVAEAIMYIDREEVAGPDYFPIKPEIQKWASQQGSVFIGDQKVVVDRFHESSMLYRVNL